jgi:hypothetical protein
MSKLKISVAKYIAQQIAISGKSQREIAEDLGYKNPNVITMFKTEQTKIPVNKVPALARSLNLDPLFLLGAVMSEYMPETWAEIEKTLGSDRMLTDEERAALKLIRTASGGIPLELSLPDNKDIFTSAVKEITKKNTAKSEASLARYLSLPANQRSAR